MNSTVAVQVRLARPDDLVPIVRMLADDPIASGRERVEDPLPAAYRAALDAIERDANNELAVAERDGRVVGVLRSLDVFRELARLTQ